MANARQPHDPGQRRPYGPALCLRQTRVWGFEAAPLPAGSGLNNRHLARQMSIVQTRPSPTPRQNPLQSELKALHLSFIFDICSKFPWFHKSYKINILRKIWSTETGNPSNRCAEAFVEICTPMKAKILAMAGVAGLGVLAAANADEMQFITLPEVVRTTVVRESNIPDYYHVTYGSLRFTGEATSQKSITQSLEQHP